MRDLFDRQGFTGVATVWSFECVRGVWEVPDGEQQGGVCDVQEQMRVDCPSEGRDSRGIDEV